MPKFPFHTLMVQGTTSDAGKSTIVAGLCRLLRRDGFKVVPFKPQNMALNSAVTVDGGEIGRAQALQAQAAGVQPHTDMNPVLLKPSSDTGAQVIVHGKVRADMQAQDYHRYKTTAMQAVLESYGRLREAYDPIVVEGAGSPAEINLRDRDIANMGFAEAVDCPVILVADIDRGGVFAHIVGTLACLSESERRRIVGFVINRFRGDIKLLEPGLDWLEAQTGKKVLGVIPYLQGLMLDAEDALSLPVRSGRRLFRIAVPVYPRISNHTDLDALRLQPDIELMLVGPGQAMPPADLIILPGSKNTRADLKHLRDQGWDQAIVRHLRYGGKVIGICGGLQMLGSTIEDMQGLEGEPGSSPGLGLLDLRTRLMPHKQLRRVEGYCLFQKAGVGASGGDMPSPGGAMADIAAPESLIPVAGYEIHMGVSAGEAMSRPAFSIDGRPEGCLSSDGQILGTYLHGLFDQAQACRALLQWAGWRGEEIVDLDRERERSLDCVADSLEAVYRALSAMSPWQANPPEGA